MFIHYIVCVYIYIYTVGGAAAGAAGGVRAAPRGGRRARPGAEGGNIKLCYIVHYISYYVLQYNMLYHSTVYYIITHYGYFMSNRCLSIYLYLYIYICIHMEASARQQSCSEELAGASASVAATRQEVGEL